MDNVVEVKKRKRSVKLTLEKSREMQLNIRRQIQEHVGTYAIILEKTSRNVFSYFVLITPQGGKEAFYDENGNFRCYLTKTIDPIRIMTGEQSIIYLDRI